MTAVAPRFDAVIHPPPRLQICGLLAAVDTMEFATVRDRVAVSDSVLSAATGVSGLDAYLATTPGGLYAVLATATGSGADATFVLAVQVLRLFVMLLAAPLVARRLRRHPG